MTKQSVNGVDVEMTAEEITAQETRQASATTSINIIKANNTAKATAQAGGNTKLLALGLTQAEATALTGYTPSED